MLLAFCLLHSVASQSVLALINQIFFDITLKHRLGGFQKTEPIFRLQTDVFNRTFFKNTD